MVMAELTNIASEISKGKRVSDNLSKYASGMNLLYKRIAEIKLALNMFSFSQVYGEDDGYRESLYDYGKRLSEIVDKYVLSETESAEEAAKVIDDLRCEIMAKMEVLTSYVDRLQVYEYVLNRVEYRFKEADVTPQYYFDKFEKDIINYIASDKDQSVVNSKICEVVGQLPMRLSKNKFYDILSNVFTLYKGAEKKSLDDFCYMIRSHAALYTPAEYDTAFPYLFENVKQLSKYTYAEISSEDYNEASELLYNSSEFVNKVTDLYVMLMDAVNDAYMYILSSSASLDSVEEKEACFAIIAEASKAVGKCDLPSEEIFDKFVMIEGLQEKLYTQLSKDGYALDDVKNSYNDEVGKSELDLVYANLFKCELLNSGSSFVSLEQIVDTAVVSENEVLEACDGILKEFAAIFAEIERPVARAIMATVLSGLPVFFTNQEELKDYIHVSLGQCKDEAERQGVMHIMLQLFDEANY